MTAQTINMSSVKPLTRMASSQRRTCPNRVRNRFFKKIGIDAHSSTMSSGMAPPSKPRATSHAIIRSIASHSINAVNSSVSIASNASSVRPLIALPASSRNFQSVPRSSEPLKYNHLDEYNRDERERSLQFLSLSSSEHSHSSSTSVDSQKKKKRITFKDDVNVVPIPMRNEYSGRVRTRLWNSAHQIYRNAARNSVEFAAENWDWRQVYDDEKMCICCTTGDLIHPVHYNLEFEDMTSYDYDC